MTAQELDTMVKEMRNRHATINSRMDLGNYPYYLSLGLKAIGRYDLANQLSKLYDEIETVETSDLMEVGTFLDT